MYKQYWAGFGIFLSIFFHRRRNGTIKGLVHHALDLVFDNFKRIPNNYNYLLRK